MSAIAAKAPLTIPPATFKTASNSSLMVSSRASTAVARKSVALWVEVNILVKSDLSWLAAASSCPPPLRPARKPSMKSCSGFPVWSAAAPAVVPTLALGRLRFMASLPQEHCTAWVEAGLDAVDGGW